jgi:hypothetical protein
MYLLLQAKRVFWDPLRLKWGKGDPMGPAPAGSKLISV